jgi:hypothetical protein
MTLGNSYAQLGDVMLLRQGGVRVRREKQKGGLETSLGFAKALENELHLPRL